MNPSEMETAMKPTPGSPGEHEHAGETCILRHGQPGDVVDVPDVAETELDADNLIV